MAIKRIKVEIEKYQASDGTEHNTLTDARQHEIMNLLSPLGRHYEMDDIVQLMLNNRVTFIRVLQDVGDGN